VAGIGAWAAVRASVAVVRQLAPADLSRPTPCAEWDLADLLAHMTAQHHGFAAAAAGNGADAEVWCPRPLGSDPARAYTAAAECVIAAFTPDDVLDREFTLPEISTCPILARQAIGFHFVDCVAHGWDVAMAIRVPFTLDAEVLRAALPIAEAVPIDERRLAPGAAFCAAPAGPRRRRPALSAPDAARAPTALAGKLTRPEAARPAPTGSLATM
jgi:uncharacterized protein (TIGR03086 family)